MDDLNTLQSVSQSLGFSLPSPAYIAGVILFSLVGIAAFGYGRKTQRPRAKWIGLALMLYPYVVSSTLWMYLVGAALCAGLYFYRD
jgi:hypothetical protein